MKYPCPEGKYHSFKVLISNPEIQKETCRFCHLTKYYKVVDGRIDNAQYLRDHMRDFAQPGTRVFEEVNGAKKAKEMLKEAEYAAGSQKRQDDLSHEFKKYIADGGKTTFL